MIYTSLFILVAIAILTFLYSMLTGKVGIFFTQWVVYLVWFFCVPAFLQYSAHQFPWPNYPKDNEINEVNTMSIVFTLFLFIGYSLCFKRTREKSTSGYRYSITTMTNALAIIMLLPAVVFIQITGVGSFFSGRSSLGEMVYADSFMPMLYALSKFVAFGVLVVYLSLWKTKTKDFKHASGATFVLMMSVIVNFIINNPLSSPRFHFLSMTIALVIMAGFMNSKKSFIILFFASPILLFFLFPAIKHLGDSSQDFKTYDTASYIVQGVDFDSFQQLVNILRYVQDKGYSYGMNFIAGVCFFIPRFIWESKPSNLGILAADHQGYFYTNLSAPLVGELYYAGDFIFIILGAVILGGLTGKADSLLRNKTISPMYLTGLWISSFAFIVFRGSFGSVAPPITLGLCSSLILFASTKKYQNTQVN